MNGLGDYSDLRGATVILDKGSALASAAFGSCTRMRWKGVRLAHWPAGKHMGR